MINNKQSQFFFLDIVLKSSYSICLFAFSGPFSSSSILVGVTLRPAKTTSLGRKATPLIWSLTLGWIYILAEES